MGKQRKRQRSADTSSERDLESALSARQNAVWVQQPSANTFGAVLCSHGLQTLYQEYEAAHAEHYQREKREDWVWWDPPAAAKQSLAVADSWADRGEAICLDAKGGVQLELTPKVVYRKHTPRGQQIPFCYVPVFKGPGGDDVILLQRQVHADTKHYQDLEGVWDIATINSIKHPELSSVATTFLQQQQQQQRTGSSSSSSWVKALGWLQAAVSGLPVGTTSVKLADLLARCIVAMQADPSCSPSDWQQALKHCAAPTSTAGSGGSSGSTSTSSDPPTGSQQAALCLHLGLQLSEQQQQLQQQHSKLAAAEADAAGLRDQVKALQQELAKQQQQQQ